MRQRLPQGAATLNAAMHGKIAGALGATPLEKLRATLVAYPVRLITLDRARISGLLPGVAPIGWPFGARCQKAVEIGQMPR